MGNLKMPRWPDEVSRGAGGLLDGLPPPVRGSGLDFLFGEADGQGGLTIGQVDPGALVPERLEGDYLSVPGPKNPIGPVEGYPETGKNSWRARNDDVIVAAVKKYNAKNGFLPGDMAYMTPQLMKSWMMQESGSGADRHAFETDPFQVNNRRDWPKFGEKEKIAGLSYGQDMTPETSAEAALKWLQFKGTVHRADGSGASYRGPYEALRNYNAKRGFVDGIPKKDVYANDIMNRAWASYGDWQK